MAVKIPRIVAAFGHRRVNRDIAGHAPRDEGLQHEGADQLQPLGVGKLGRQAHVKFAAELGILPELRSLDRREQGLPIAQRLRRAGRQHHLSMHHAATSGIVMHLTRNRIDQALTGPVGRSGDC